MNARTTRKTNENLITSTLIHEGSKEGVSSLSRYNVFYVPDALPVIQSTM